MARTNAAAIAMPTAADRDYKPPQDNAWRIYDLLLEAHTPIPLALGDPTELAHLAARGH